MGVHDDSDREARRRILGKFIQAQLEKARPRITSRLNQLAGVFDLTLADVKQAAKTELDRFTKNELDV